MGGSEGLGAPKPRWTHHPDRARLLAEAHARPAVPLATPMLAARIATLSGEDGMAADRAHMAALCMLVGQSEPEANARWHGLEAEGWRLRWERHTEFSTWSIFRAPRGSSVFAESALDDLPADWLAELPGAMLVATRVDLWPSDHVPHPLRHFGQDAAGALLADGAMAVYTDFRAGADDATRFLLLGSGADEALAGRTVRSLLEIETYRLMALLAFPVAGAASQEVKRIEAEASELAGQLAGAADPDKDRELLARLATLAGEAETLGARTGFRFAAGRAYHDIVRDRIADLREERAARLQTLGEFMDRRLAPAMRTCDSVERRERAAIERIARTERMLNTRVELAAEAASTALLASMDRRAHAQLRLQRTVEGLSVAAISYYTMGLLLFVLAAAAEAEPGFDPRLAAGLLTPLVVLAVWLVVRRLRRKIDLDEPAR